MAFVMSDATTLADLLALNLHSFEDEVRNIVDKAVKEMSMEKVLKELDVTWSAMEFEHETHARTGEVLIDDMMRILQGQVRLNEFKISTLQDQVRLNKFKMRTLQ